MRLPFVTIAILLAVLVPVGFATESTDKPQPPAAKPPPPSASVTTIAKRVETLRELRYKRIPRPVRVTSQQATQDGLADLDRGYPVGARRADEALYTLLGLLPAGTDLRDVSASIFGDQVAGYYDPRSKQLRIVAGAATSNRVLDEVTIAHELTHALDDQAIGLDEQASETSDDRGYAYDSLVEGAATAVMYAYLGRYFNSEVALGGLLGGSLAVGSTQGLPPFILAGLLFPYQAGQQFVDELYRRGGRSWTLVDLAERSRPPVSTEQVIHPQKWIASELPGPVTVPRVPGPGWRMRTEGTFGEWQTGQLLALGGQAQPDAAAGWGGDRYVLYRRGGADCATPCSQRDALVLRWRFDTARDARQFAPALRTALTEGLGAKASGRGAYALRGAAAVIARGEGRTTLALAPRKGLARRLSRARLR